MSLKEDALIHMCDAEVIIEAGDEGTNCALANIQVFFDQEVYLPKIMITDSDTGEIVVDMAVPTDTKFEVC